MFQKIICFFAPNKNTFALECFCENSDVLTRTVPVLRVFSITAVRFHINAGLRTKKPPFGRELGHACAKPSCHRRPNKAMVWKLSAVPAKYSSLHAFGGSIYMSLEGHIGSGMVWRVYSNLKTPSALPLFYTHISGWKMIIPDV